MKETFGHRTSSEHGTQAEYYEKLQNLVDHGRLTVRLIVAPTRSGSTLLEESLSMSPDVDFKYHEPLLLYDSQGASINPFGYEQIYQRIGGNNFEKSSQSATLLIKDINFWLYSYGEYKRLFGLAKDPILFLIRNPILTMESRIKKVAETLPMNADIVTTRDLLHLCAQNVESEVSNQQVFDLYSRQQGFTNWDNLLDFSFQNHAYARIGKVLEISKSWFRPDAWGAESIEGEIVYLKNLNRDVILIDSSEFRLCPEKVSRTICQAWSMRYKKQMINWGEGNLHLDPTANTEWFTRIAASGGVQPPIEIPPVLKEFPDFVQNQLTQKDIPAYIRLMRHPAMITNKGVNNILFDIPVLPQDRKRLHKLGVIDERMKSPSRVTIRDIDPVFALSREPQLATDSFYLKRKKAYADVIKIIKAS